MMPHPTMLHATSDLRRWDLLAIADRERRAANVGDPALQWRPPVARVLAVVALALGLRI